MYNKKKYRKINDKKVLRKVHKRWVVMSVAVLSLLGVATAAASTPTHASTTQSISTASQSSAQSATEVSSTASESTHSVAHSSTAQSSAVSMQGQNPAGQHVTAQSSVRQLSIFNSKASSVSNDSHISRASVKSASSLDSASAKPVGFHSVTSSSVSSAETQGQKVADRYLKNVQSAVMKAGQTSKAQSQDAGAPAIASVPASTEVVHTDMTYYFNHHAVASSSVAGSASQAATLKATDVPVGYKLANDGTQYFVYGDQAHYDVNVIPVDEDKLNEAVLHSHNPRVTDTIRYYDFTDGMEKDVPFTAKRGYILDVGAHPVDLGLGFDSSDNTQQITINGNQTHTVYVVPMPVVTSKISYKYHGNTVGSTKMQDTTGDQFTDNGDDVPSGYQLAGDDTASFLFNAQPHTVNVVPKHGAKTLLGATFQQDNDTLVFTNAANNQQVGTVTQHGINGAAGMVATNFIPAHYQLANDGTEKFTYDNGPHMVDVLPVMDSDIVNYVYNDPNNGVQSLGQDSVKGQDGQQYTIQANDSTIPTGYHLANDGSQVFTLNANGQHTVNLLPDQEHETVTFVNFDGTVAQGTSPISISGSYGTTYNVDSSKIPAHLQADDPSSLQVPLDGQNHTIEVVSIQDTVSLQFVDNSHKANDIYNGKVVSTQNTSANDGSHLDVNSINIPELQNYHLANDGTQAFTVTNGAQKINVLPNNETDTVILNDPEHNVTIDNQVLAHGFYGEDGDSVMPKIPHYTLNSANGNDFVMDGGNHTLNVSPQQVVDTINYIYDGQKKGSTQVAGTYDEAIENVDNPFTNVPNGYVPTWDDSSSFTLNGGVHNVNITQNIDNDTIDYMYNGQLEGTTNISGQDSSTIPISNTPGLAPGYQLTGTQSITFDDGSHNVSVMPIMDTDTIQYVNENGQTVGTDTVQAVQFTNYTVTSKDNVPDHYALDNDGTQNIMINGSTHQVSVEPANATDTINYVYNGNTLKTVQISGNDNQQGIAGQGVPAGYQLANDGTQHFVFNDSVHQVDLQPINKTDTVNYVYNGQQEGSTIVTGPYNQPIILNGQGISNGYQLANDGTQVIAADGQEHDVNVTPSPVTETIKFISDGQPIGQDQLNGLYGQNGTAQYAPAGYSLADDGSETFTFDGRSHNVNVIAQQAGPVTISFTDQSGNEMSQTENGTTGQVGTVQAPLGYTLAPGQKDTYRFAPDAQTLNYKINGKQQNGVVTIVITDTDDDAKDSVQHVAISGPVGSSYTIDPAKYAPSGTKVQSSPLVGHFITSGIDQPSAVFNYSDQGGAAITVDYVNQNGKLLKSATLVGSTGSQGNIPMPPVQGYHLMPGQARSYTINDQPQTMTVHMQGDNESFSAKITVEMKDNKGKIISDKTITVPVHSAVGNHYTVSASNYVPNGYDIDSGDLSGIVQADGLSNDTATFVYKPTVHQTSGITPDSSAANSQSANQSSAENTNSAASDAQSASNNTKSISDQLIDTIVYKDGDQNAGQYEITNPMSYKGYQYFCTGQDINAGYDLAFDGSESFNLDGGTHIVHVQSITGQDSIADSTADAQIASGFAISSVASSSTDSFAGILASVASSAIKSVEVASGGVAYGKDNSVAPNTFNWPTYNSSVSSMVSANVATDNELAAYGYYVPYDYWAPYYANYSPCDYYDYDSVYNYDPFYVGSDTANNNQDWLNNWNSVYEDSPYSYNYGYGYQPVTYSAGDSYPMPDYDPNTDATINGYAPMFTNGYQDAMQGNGMNGNYISYQDYINGYNLYINGYYDGIEGTDNSNDWDNAYIPAYNQAYDYGNDYADNNDISGLQYQLGFNDGLEALEADSNDLYGNVLYPYQNYMNGYNDALYR